MQLIACDGVSPEAAAAHWAAAAAAVRKAFCPARAAGASCGCLPHLGHQVTYSPWPPCLPSLVLCFSCCLKPWG